MSMRLLFVFYFYLWFPMPATAAVQPSHVYVIEQAKVGDFVRRLVLACFKKRDIDQAVNPHSDLQRVGKLFKNPYSCTVDVVEILLLELRRKFKDADGNEFWTIGVGREDGKVLFYIAFPAAELKLAP